MKNRYPILSSSLNFAKPIDRQKNLTPSKPQGKYYNLLSPQGELRSSLENTGKRPKSIVRDAPLQDFLPLIKNETGISEISELVKDLYQRI